ncbi:MAG: hypothetical protein DME30_05530 [Verrucomicrobia bacterium]|nr:MAG: hypothetical protein DME30_05530 [Verrucomicrobiota bacterium]
MLASICRLGCPKFCRGLSSAVNWVAPFLFFFVATPALKSVPRNLRVIRLDSWRVMNYLRGDQPKFVEIIA